MTVSDPTAPAAATVADPLRPAVAAVDPIHAADVAELTSVPAAAGVGVPAPASSGRPRPAMVTPPQGILDLGDSIPIADVVWRNRAQVSGKVRSIRVRPWGEVVTLEAVIADASGALTVGFLGRRKLGGLRLGGAFTAEGMVGARDGKLLILNPAYDLRDHS